MEQELERQARLLALGVEEVGDGLGRHLSSDERRELLAEARVLEGLLDQIERRRFALAATAASLRRSCARVSERSSARDGAALNPTPRR